MSKKDYHLRGKAWHDARRRSACAQMTLTPQDDKRARRLPFGKEMFDPAKHPPPIGMIPVDEPAPSIHAGDEIVGELKRLEREEPLEKVQRDMGAEIDGGLAEPELGPGPGLDLVSKHYADYDGDISIIADLIIAVSDRLSARRPASAKTG